MKLIEDIHKKLFKELELIYQRQVDDCILIKFKIFGLLRPKACIDVFSRNDVKVVVYNGNKMIYETELEHNNRIDISERISIFQPNSFFNSANSDWISCSKRSISSSISSVGG